MSERVGKLHTKLTERFPKILEALRQAEIGDLIEVDGCPLCGRPIAATLCPTEAGAEWFGECQPCNAIVEIL